MAKAPPGQPAAPPPRSSAPPTNGKRGVEDDIVAPEHPLSITKGPVHAGQKIIVYGTGGVGKTELCSLLPQVGIEPLYIDAEDSSKFLDVSRIVVNDWDDVRSVLHDRQLMECFGAIVVESLTKLEEFAVAWTKANIPHEKGHKVRRLEDYGFGKGFTHVYETFLTLLGDLDAIARSGKHVICTAHVCTEVVPNPAGENWLQYQPRLQSPPKTGKIRERVKEWADHLLYVGFDQIVEDGKARGCGTRTIHSTELPTHWAKSRTMSESVPYLKGHGDIWQALFGGEEHDG